MDFEENKIYTFAADNSELYNSMGMSLLFVVIGLGVMYFFLKKTKESAVNRNQNYLIAMLAFFVFMIAGCTAFFSWATTAYKIKDVIVSVETIETGDGVSQIKHISKVYYHKDVQRSLINPGMQKGSTQFLIIEEIKGKTHALSAENYNIQQIHGLLKKRMKK